LGKQYKQLTDEDIVFIREQKLFYIASSSGREVNLSPKGYDSIRVLDASSLLFLGYPGSGNRSYRDAAADGEFTLLFNAFGGAPKILRLFCKAEIVGSDDERFARYLPLFGENERLVRNLFIFHIYAVESSCGESIPYMEYQGERQWVVKMDESGRLAAYNADHFTPPDLKKI